MVRVRCTIPDCSYKTDDINDDEGSNTLLSIHYYNYHAPQSTSRLQRPQLEDSNIGFNASIEEQHSRKIKDEPSEENYVNVSIKVKVPKDIHMKDSKCLIETTLQSASVDLQKALSKTQYYPLHNVLRNNGQDSEQIKRLVKEKNINLKDHKGKTPLHYAYKNDSNIKILLKNGADPEKVSPSGDTLLHLYCSRKKESCYEAKTVELILEKSGGDILKKKNKRNQTAFDIAKETGKNDLLYLLDTKGDHNITCKDDNVNKLMKAIQEKNKPHIELLRKEPEAFRTTLSIQLNKHGMTLLDFAVKHSDESIVTLLIKDTNIDVSGHLDADQLNPIHYASKDAKHHDKMRALLKISPKSVNSQCINQKTPLHYAVENNCHKNIDFLLNQDEANVTITDAESKNILHYIIRKKSNGATKYKDRLKKILNHKSFELSALLCLEGCETSTKSVIDYAVQKDCMIVLVEIGKKIFNLQLTISWYHEVSDANESSKLFAILDEERDNSQPLWKSLCNILQKDKYVDLGGDEVTRLSDQCFYKLGNALIDHMKTKRVKFSLIKSIIQKKLPHRKDILDCLDDLENAGFNVFNDELSMANVEKLEICLGNRSTRKNDWMVICDGVKIIKSDQQILKRSCIDSKKEEYSPSKSLFRLLRQNNPGYHMIKVYKALKEISFEASRHLIANFAEIVKEKINMDLNI